MFCGNCGKKLQDGAVFCPYCGMKQKADEERKTFGETETGAGAAAVGSGEASESPGMDRAAFTNPQNAGTSSGKGAGQIPGIAVIAGGALVGLLVVLILVLTYLNKGITISAVDYVSVEATGLNSEGAAVISFDRNALLSDLEAKKTLQDEEKEQIFAALESVLDNISLSKVTGLANGDKIEVETSLDEKLLKKFGVNLKNGSVTVEVDGLTDIQEVNLTDYIRVEFSGYDGAGYASASIDTVSLRGDLLEMAEAAGTESDESVIETDVEYSLYWINLEGNVPEHLSNGDEVQETVSYSASDLEEYGIRFTGGTYTETAQGLLEPEELDLTEAVKVSFSGVCPNVLVNFEVDREVPYYYETSLSSLGSERITASNGDFYTLEITYDEYDLLALGYVVTNSEAEYEISGLNDYRLNLSGTEDENLQTLSANFEENAVEGTLDRQDRILEAEGESIYSAAVVWNEMNTSLCRAELQISGGESSTENQLLLVYRMALPVLHLDRSISQANLYYLVCCYDVEQTPDGELIWDNWDGTFYLNEEELNAAIQNYGEYLGENAQVTELAQESEAEDLSSEELQANVTNSQGTFSGTPDPDAGSVIETGTDGAAVISWEGHRYIRFDEKMTWQEAEQYCESLTGEDGGAYHLATVTSERERLVIQTLLQDAPYERYWLGATDEEFEGDWKWVTGETFDGAYWDSSQPDNADENDEGCETYLELGSRFSYLFNDSNNSDDDRGFIAEWESAEAKEEGVYLTDLTPESCYDAGEHSILQDPYGNLHFGSLYLDGSESAVVTYELDGAYTALDGNFSTWADAESGARFSLAIWGDGELLYACYDYKKTDAPIALSLDLTGVQTLKIQADAIGDTYNGYLFLNECRLTKAAEPVMDSAETEELCALRLLASESYTQDEGAMYSDVFGYFRRDCYWMDASENGYAAWRLVGGYTQLDAVVMADTESYSEATSVDVKISADGEVLWEQELTVFDGPVAVSLDLTGREKLEISASKKEDGGYGRLYLADTMLTRAVSGDNEEESAVLASDPVYPELDEESISKASAQIEYRDAQKSIRYYLFEEPMTWVEASEFCRQAGGSLAQPMTAEENETISLLLENGTADAYWLGGQMAGNGAWLWSGGSQDGTVWRKADGTEDGFYTNWAGGEPNNSDGVEYLLAIYPGGLWNDYADEPLPFVMEVDATGQESQEQIVYWNENGTADGYRTLAKDGVYYPYGTALDASGGYALSYDTLPVSVGDQSIWPGTLKGVLFVNENASVYADISVEIFGDGELLYECDSLGPQDGVISFEVNIDGVQNLVISADNQGVKDNGVVYFGYLAFCGSSESAKIVPGRLSSLVQVDAGGFDSRTGVLFRDLYGEVHDGYLALDGEQDGYVVYNLGEGASTFSGTLTAGNGSAYKADTSVRIYDGEGNLLYEMADYSAEDGEQEFSVDITGATVLRIETGGTDDSEGAWVYLTDDKLFSSEGQ